MSETASMQIRRQDLRARRAMSLASAVMDKISHLICDCGEEPLRRVAHDAILDIFFQEGVEVLTDYDREQMGLQPRSPDGWTIDEIIALEKRRLEIMTRPLQMLVPIDATERKVKA